MTPPFMYYGSKARLAPWIVSLLPAHRAYVEPFAGSASVLLAKAPSRHEALNDLDGEVHNFWTVLRDQGDKLREVLELTPYSRREYLECRDGETPLEPVERARRFFVVANMAFNASANGKVGYGSGTPRKNGSKPATFARRVAERLAPVAERLRNVELQDVDALSLLKTWDHRDTVAYLDPPYLGESRLSGGDYATDNPTEDFHARLLEVCNRFQGTVVLSGYASPLYREMTEGWEVHALEVPAHTSTTAGARRTECVWIKR